MTYQIDQVILNFVFEGTNKIWLCTSKLVLEFEIDSKFYSSE